MVAKWEDAKAGFWDSAVKGSEALRTAIAREVKNEVCVELGKPAVQICWDMEKFYDTIEPGLVAKEGRKLGYPIKELYMGILVHRSSRILRATVGSLLMSPHGVRFWQVVCSPPLGPGWCCTICWKRPTLGLQSASKAG